MDVLEVSGTPAYDGTAVTELTPGTTSKAMPALSAGQRLLGEAVEDGRVAVHEAHDEAARVRPWRPARRAWRATAWVSALAVVAVAGVDDLDVGAAPAVDDGLAGRPGR